MTWLAEAGLSECADNPTCAADFNRGFAIFLLELGAGWVLLCLAVWMLVRLVQRRHRGKEEQQVARGRE